MKFTKKDIPMLLLCFGTLLFPFVLRERLIDQFALINLPVWFALFYAYRKDILRLSSKKAGQWILLPYLVVALLLLFLIPGNGWSIKRKILLILIYLLPSVFLCSDICDALHVERFAKIWLTCLRSVCIFMCLCYFVDSIIGTPYLQYMFAKLYRNDTLEYMISENRLVSYLGHPLASAGVFLMLLVWGTIDSHIHPEQKVMYLLDVTISLFGVFLCASKAALLVSFILLVFNCIQRRSLKEMLILLAILGLFHMTNVSEQVIERVEDGIESGDITTGRSDAIEIMVSDDTLNFNLLQGHVYEYDNDRMIAALENPFLGWAFTCGIVFAVIQYLMYFVYPGLKVLFSGNLTLLMCMLALMAYENASNGLYSFNDDLVIYTMNMWLILQVTANNTKETSLWKKLKS